MTRPFIILSLVFVFLVGCKDHGIAKRSAPEEDAAKLCACMQKAKNEPDHANYCAKMTNILEEKYKHDTADLVAFAQAMSECIKRQSPN